MPDKERPQEHPETAHELAAAYPGGDAEARAVLEAIAELVTTAATVDPLNPQHKE